MRFKNLILVGTSHIAAESVSAVDRAILNESPGIVALELDRKRLFALLNPGKAKLSWKDMRRVGFKGWLFSIIGAWIEKKLGEKVGMKPGAEMLQAVKSARVVGAHLALVDQDIEITLRRFSQGLTWREKWRLLVDVLKGLLFRKSEFVFDLSTVPNPKLIDRMIRQVKLRYPNVYRVLVTERNFVMAKRLAFLMKHHPDTVIVAVIGAGHEKELVAIVKKELS